LRRIAAHCLDVQYPCILYHLRRAPGKDKSTGTQREGVQDSFSAEYRSEKFWDGRAGGSFFFRLLLALLSWFLTRRQRICSFAQVKWRKV